MEPSQLLMCDACGTVARVEKVLRLNVAAPTFCPYCGHKGIKQVKSSFPAINAACFAGLPHHIIEHFWATWARNEHNEQTQHTTLLSYVRARLQELARTHKP